MEAKPPFLGKEDDCGCRPIGGPICKHSLTNEVKTCVPCGRLTNEDNEDDEVLSQLSLVIGGQSPSGWRWLWTGDTSWLLTHFKGWEVLSAR